MAINILLNVRDASGSGAEAEIFDKSLIKQGWQKVPGVPLSFEKKFPDSIGAVDVARKTEQDVKDAAVEADWSNTDAAYALSGDSVHSFHFDPRNTDKQSVVTKKETLATIGDKSEPELSPSTLAFLLSDIIEAESSRFRKITWSDLGVTGDEIKKVIADQNINLNDSEVTVEICGITYDKSSAAVVDVSYSGGGEAPDPFRFIYLVSGGKYIGNAGDVAS